MSFSFSEEQIMLRESVQRFLEQRCPISEVRKLKVTDAGYSEDHWKEMAESAWLGITMPEEYGGIELTWLDLVVILEEMGKGLFPSPFISNILASTAILEAGSSEQKQANLPAMIDGSKKGAVALAEAHGDIAATATALSSTADGEGFVLNGQKVNVMDPESADVFVVSFRCGGEVEDVALALVDAKAAGVEAKHFPMLDETKRMGNLTLMDVKVSADQVLCKGEQAVKQLERLLDLGAIAMTAEMSGAAGESLHLTAEYAKERTQFGHPIGHYQGVKHPLAELYVDIESFRSMLYYGAWSVENRQDFLSRYASLTKAYATEVFIRMGTESIQIHGATGYMTEVDIHLYYMRTKWARPMFGDSVAHYERAFALRQQQGIADIEVELTDEEKVFRDEVRGFLDENNPPKSERSADAFNTWLKAVREARYIGFSWPKECGGYGGTLMQQFILKAEMLKVDAQMIGTDYTGLGWVGPAVMQFGTEEQKERFLPDILDSKTAWCTGYSEPGVGSDLANLQCKAVLEGDEYVVNGQKIWTSLAHMGTGLYCLVRTGFGGNKHEGLTCLLIPLDTPGIEVRPIESFAIDHFAHLYNEVFLTDVRVPLANRIGKEGDGWAIICSALQNERSGIAEVNRHHKGLERLEKLAGTSHINGKPALESEELRLRFSSFDARIEACRLNGLRALAKQVTGTASDSEASLNKMHNCHLLVDMAETGMELLGHASPYVGNTDANIGRGKWQIGAMGWPTTVIGGGTPNIQRNIIAERMLGLPKD